MAKGALQDSALWHGHQSAALFSSNCGAFCRRKRRDLRHFFKCCCATFVAFSFTHAASFIVYSHSYVQVENVVGGVPNDSQPLSPLPDEARHSRTPVMAAGDKVSRST